MPKPKKEIMRAMRAERKEQGFVEYRAWVKPEEKVELEKKLQNLRDKD